MRLRDRPRHQLVLGSTVVLLLLGPVVVWGSQAVRMLAGCDDGLGNPGLTGRLTMTTCVLSDQGRPLLRLPLAEDLAITGLLAFVLLSVIAALSVPRWSKWSHSLAVLAAPALVFAGMAIGRRGFQRRDGELAEFVLRMPADSPGEGGVGSARGGWQVAVGGRVVLVPDVSAIWLGLSFLAGLALVVLVIVLVVDHRRRVPAASVQSR